MGSNPQYGIGGYGSGLYGNQPVETLPVGYYFGLLASQYSLPNSPKLNALLALLLHKLDDISECQVSMDGLFNLDVATGMQLDVLGAIAGVSRTVGFQPSGGVSPVLDDATYRLLVRAKVAQNQWDGRIGSLQPIWHDLFPTGTIIIDDRQSMSAYIILTGTFTSIERDLITNGYIVPRPEGVRYNYFFTLPIFGFDQNTTIIAGFDQGKWS
jgi:hypothetical protein